VAGRLLDVKGAADYLGRSERWVRHAVYQRRIPFVKMGEARNSALRFDPADLDRWVQAHKVPEGVR